MSKSQHRCSLNIQAFSWGSSAFPSRQVCPHGTDFQVQQPQALTATGTPMSGFPPSPPAVTMLLRPQHQYVKLTPCRFIFLSPGMLLLSSSSCRDMVLCQLNLEVLRFQSDGSGLASPPAPSSSSSSNKKQCNKGWDEKKKKKKKVLLSLACYWLKGKTFNKKLFLHPRVPTCRSVFLSLFCSLPYIFLGRQFSNLQLNIY